MRTQLRTAFMPINPLLLAWVLSISPAYSDSSQRKILFDKINNGQATDADVDQFINSTLKDRQERKQKFEVTAKQNDLTNDQLNRVERQNQKINAALFGGVSIYPNVVGGSGGGLLNAGTQQIFTTQITPTSEALRFRAPMPNVIGGLTLPLTPEINRITAGVVDASLEGKVCNNALANYSRPFSKWWAGTKDMINYSMPYRATGPSSMAADVILNEKLKLNSLQACLYAKRKLLDDTRLTLITTLYNAANTGSYAELDKLIGKTESDHLQYVLATHQNDNWEAEGADGGTWDFSEKSRRYGNLVKTALEHDKVVSDIVDSLHKYNQNKNKALNVTAHVIEPILGAAAYVPNLVGPIAHGILCGLIYVSGGPETDKIIKELYLDKCLESRSHLMTEQARISLDAYQQAVQQNNTVLFYCAKTIINDMLL